MQVFLIRHAEAVDQTRALGDSQRHLTESGRHQARALGERLRWYDCAPTHIWSSPLVRAIQTAELIAGQLQSEVMVEAIPALALGESPRELVSALTPLPDDVCVLLVGHEPALSAIAALLTGQPQPGTIARAEAMRIDDGAVRWRFPWNADAPSLPA